MVLASSFHLSAVGGARRGIAVAIAAIAAIVPGRAVAGSDCDWWRQPNPCPPGTRLAGAAPPRGTSVLCVKPDGRLHGKWTKWRDSGDIEREAVYRDGHLERAVGCREAREPLRRKEDTKTGSAGLPRLHDAVFMQLMLGAAGGWVQTDYRWLGSPTDARTSGLGAFGEVLAGGTPDGGPVVLGLGILLGRLVAPAVEASEPLPPGAYLRDVEPAGVVGYGAFMRVYPEQSWGLYLQAFGGFAESSGGHLEDRAQAWEDRPARWSGSGAVVAFGSGYELWLGEQWSLGPALRYSWARTHLAGRRDWETVAVIQLFALGASLTYH